MKAKPIAHVPANDAAAIEATIRIPLDAIRDMIKDALREQQPKPVSLPKLSYTDEETAAATGRLMAKDLLGTEISRTAIYSYEQIGQLTGFCKRTIQGAIKNGHLRGGNDRVTGRAALHWIEFKGARTGRNAGDVKITSSAKAPKVKKRSS